MADIVWSPAIGLPGASRSELDDLVEMARLWAAHLRGPGEHRGPIVLLTNLPALEVPGASVLRVSSAAASRREVFAERPVLATRHLRPGPDDRCMQLDLDSLARHPLALLFDAIAAGEMRVAPSMLPLTHEQQAGRFLGRFGRLWFGRVRGWNRHLGVSASLTACLGADWSTFMGAWVDAIRRHSAVASRDGRPGDQGYLNLLYARRTVPMRRYGPREIHHLRVPDEAPPEQIETAHVLHFPVPDKLRRMREWSRL